MRGKALLAGLIVALATLPGTAVTAAPAPVQAENPAGIAVRGEELIAAEAGRGRVVAVAPGGSARTLISGLTPGVFTRGPTGVALDGNGNVYAAVAEEGAVRFVTPTGESGVYARGLGTPNGLAFDPAGNLYVADQAAGRVLRVTRERDSSVFASGFEQPPFGLAFGPDGDLYVSTQRDGTVWRVGPSGEPARFAEVGDSAEGLAFDSSGDLYVGDGAAGKLVRVGPGGGTTEVAGDLSGPLNLAFDGSSLLVATQGEGQGTVEDRVVRAGVTATGLPLAAPALNPTALPAAPPTFVHRGDGVAMDPAPFREVLPEGTASSTGLGGFEPTIGVTKTGAVFINPKPTAGLNTQHIMRSRDQGLTWEDVSPRVGDQIVPPTDLDPYIYVDRDTGRLFTVQLYVGCSYLAYSDDDGESWIHNPVACGIPGNDHQTLYSGPTTTLPTVGYPNAVYYCYNAIAYSGCGRSLDGGLTFHPAGAPYAAPGCAGLHGHVAVGPDGTVYLPKGDCEEGPAVSVSTTDGTTWTEVQVAGPAFRGRDHESHVAVDAKGNAYFVWTGADRRPYLSVSKDQGQTWSAPAMVGPPGITTAWGPTIAAGDEGKIAVYYYGTQGDCCYEQEFGGHTMWNVYATVSTDAQTANPVFMTTTFNDPMDPVRRGSCGPGRCGGRPTSPGDFVEVFVDHTGRTWAAVVDTCQTRCAEPGLSGSNNSELTMAGQLVRGPRLVGNGVLTPPSWFQGQGS